MGSLPTPATLSYFPWDPSWASKSELASVVSSSALVQQEACKRFPGWGRRGFSCCYIYYSVSQIVLLWPWPSVSWYLIIHLASWSTSTDSFSHCPPKPGPHQSALVITIPAPFPTSTPLTSTGLAWCSSLTQIHALKIRPLFSPKNIQRMGFFITHFM